MNRHLITYSLSILLLGVCIGSVLGFYHAKLNFGDWLILWVDIFLFIIVFRIYSLLKPNILLIKGDYLKSIKYFEKKIIHNIDNKKIKNASFYNLALCHNRLGNFSYSESYLDLLDHRSIPQELKWGYYFLSATNLMCLEQEAKKLQLYLDTAKNIYDLPELYPLLAYIESFKQNNTGASKYINEYLKYTKRKKYLFSLSNSSLITDKFTYDIKNNFLIGLTYLKLNQNTLGKEYLEKSTRNRFENYYSIEAKKLLKKLNTEV